MSIFRRVAGRITAARPSERMFDFRNTAGTSALLVINDITFDGNAQNQDTPSTTYELQQARNVNIQPADALGLSFTSRGCRHLNTVADGFALRGGAGQSFKTITISDFYAWGRLYSRSDITITGSYDECNISNFDGDSLQVETNTIDAGRLFRPNLTNIIVREGGLSTALTST